jgi:hypothetical protein
MIDRNRFLAAQAELDRRIRLVSGQPFVSLRVGLPLEWEGYKPVVRAIGRDRLAPEEWSESAIGDGRILEAAISAIEIDESRDIRNNMGGFQPRWGEASREHHRLRAARGDRAATEIV